MAARSAGESRDWAGGLHSGRRFHPECMWSGGAAHPFEEIVRVLIRPVHRVKQERHLLGRRTEQCLSIDRCPGFSLLILALCDRALRRSPRLLVSRGIGCQRLRKLDLT